MAPKQKKTEWKGTEIESDEEGLMALISNKGKKNRKAKKEKEIVESGLAGNSIDVLSTVDTPNATIPSATIVTDPIESSVPTLKSKKEKEKERKERLKQQQKMQKKTLVATLSPSVQDEVEGISNIVVQELNSNMVEGDENLDSMNTKKTKKKGNAAISALRDAVQAQKRAAEAAAAALKEEQDRLERERIQLELDQKVKEELKLKKKEKERVIVG